jgi:hypothetical protein
MRGWPLAFGGLFFFGLFASACRGGAANDLLPDAGVSPQAKAEPAQLENVAVTSNAQPLTPDAGPLPVSLRADEEAPPDTLAKDTSAWEIEAILRTAEIPPAFRGPETAIVAIDAAKRKTELRLTIDVTASRARIEIRGGGFTVPEGTELRARSDRYGHLLLLPHAREYRVAAPGSLRALLGERRIDVEPLMLASVTERGDGARRLGYRTRRVQVTNRAATAVFELARIADAGEGGLLLCRAFLDLMNAPPSTAACGLDEVPLHVEWRWATRGGLTFDAEVLTRTDVAAGAIAAPPANLSFAPPTLPEIGVQVIVESAELAAFRTAPAPDVPATQPDGSVPPAAGLVLTNATDELRFAWLDGAPIAWLAPGAKLALPSLLRGRYGFAWRTFLGDAYDAPITITTPVSQTARAGDAGAP